MPAGDLITRDGQYEYNSVLLNDPRAGTDVKKVLSCEGLFDLPPLKVVESEMGDDHGGVVGRSLLSMRRIVMEIAILASSPTNLYVAAEDLLDAFQPRDSVLPLVYQRPGAGKRFVNVRLRRFTGFRNEWAKQFGQSTATIEFVAPDPRKLSLAQSSQQIIIASGGTSAQGTVNMVGNFNGGAKPILEIAGPWTNPRITNAGDANRGVRLDIVVNAGQLLVLDSRDRSVKLDGVDFSQLVRTDNQWWVLARGANLITATRSNSPANTGTLTVKWWNSYV